MPLCALAWILLYFLLDIPKASHSHWLQKVRRVDFIGALTLAAAVASLLIGLDAGSNLGWSASQSFIPLALTPVFSALFFYVEIRVAKYPFAPGHVIFSPSLFACYLTNFFGMAGNMATLFFVPLFFQAVLGKTAGESGTLMTPATASVILSSLFGGWIIKRTGRFYWPTLLSFGLLLFSVVPLALAIWFKSILGITIALVLASLGMGSGRLPNFLVLYALLT